MATRIDSQVVSVLGAAGLSLTDATNLFRGPPLDVGGVPDDCVFVTATGGPAPQDYIDGGSGPTVKSKTALVTIRAQFNNNQAGYALAENCLDALHKSDPSGWISFEVRESAPNYIGVDEQSRHRWTFNVEGMIKE